MNIVFRRTISSVLIAAIAYTPFPTLAADKIDCESRHGRYKFCSIDTDGKVELTNEFSRDKCREGRSWGYEDKGVWVDRGCSAQFQVGRERDKHKDRKAAIAVGVVGLAALAAMAASHAREQEAQQQEAQQQEVQQNEPQQYQPEHRRGSYRWNVGDFVAYDSRLGTVVKITVQADGAVAAYSRRGDKVGNFQGNFMSIGDTRFRVERMENGFLATGQSDTSYQLRFERQRDGR